MACLKQRKLRAFKVELFIPEGPEADDLASDLMTETDFLLAEIEQLLESQLNGQRPMKCREGSLQCDYFVTQGE